MTLPFSINRVGKKSMDILKNFRLEGWGLRVSWIKIKGGRFIKTNLKIIKGPKCISLSETTPFEIKNIIKIMGGQKSIPFT